MSFEHKYPITDQKLQEILGLIEDGENVTSLWMPMSCRTDFAICLQTKAGIRPELASKLVFIYLDLSLSQEFVERQLEESLGRYSEKSGVRNKLVDIVSTGKQIVLILDNFSLENLDWVKYILSLRHEAPPKSVTFLMLAFESEFYAKRTNFTDFALIYHNIVKVPYFTKEEAFCWLGDKFDENEKQEVYAYCGGIAGLLINFLRANKRFGGVETSLQSQQMRDTVQHLWGRFSERERHVLKSIVTHGRVPPYTFELAYMKEHNLLTLENKILGGWVNTVVAVGTEEKIKTADGQLEWNGVNLAEMFTDKELAVVEQMFAKKELSRDDVARILWKNEAAGRYSDWAIDQLFSRLRKKLDQVGLGGDRIKTVKGKGFKIEGIKVL